MLVVIFRFFSAFSFSLFSFPLSLLLPTFQVSIHCVSLLSLTSFCVALLPVPIALVLLFPFSNMHARSLLNHTYSTAFSFEASPLLHQASRVIAALEKCTSVTILVSRGRTLSPAAYSAVIEQSRSLWPDDGSCLAGSLHRRAKSSVCLKGGLYCRCLWGATPTQTALISG